MKYRVYVILFLLLGLFLNFNGGNTKEMKHVDKEAIMKIYFIPFEIETYVPVTILNIEDSSIYELRFVKEHIFCTELRNLLESNKVNNKIDNKAIRLKVEFTREKNVYYVDQKGVVLKNNETYYQLSKKAMQKIEKEILYLSGNKEDIEKGVIIKVKPINN